MEVSCKQCQATYQFDAAAIPPQGYDAQCTHCGAVFFVAPEAPAEALISVHCQHCGAVYQFPASAIPAGGYDAQCTQCQQVFFVGAPAAESPTKPAPVVEPPAPVVEPPAPVVEPPALVVEPPAPVVEPPATPAPVADVPVSLGQPKGSAPPSVPPQGDRPPVAPLGDAPGAADAEDLVAMAAELGEPLSSPDGANIEEDFERILARRRRRLRVVAIVAGALVAYVAGSYLLLPRVFDLTIGRFIGVKLTVAPEAVPPTERAAGLALDDTEAAYQAAHAELLTALGHDPDYAEAIAWYGLVNILRGEDVRARGRAAHRVGAEALAELRALEELPPDGRPVDFAARSAALRKTASEASEESSRYFEAGGKLVRDGFARLRAGVEKNDRVPLLVEVAGIYYAMDSDSLKRAEELFNHAVRLRLGEQGKLDLKAPPDPWLPFLRGMILAQDLNKQAEAAAAFAAAAAKEPRLVRALWEQAKLAERQGDRPGARVLARAVLAKVPGHEKAAALLAVPEPAPVAPTPPESADGGVKAKKRKAKKKR